jgi:hypothetical protein
LALTGKSAVSEPATRLIITAPIGKDGLFIQPDTRGWSNAKKAEHELKESHNRERFAKKFDYADQFTGDTRTYDPEGRYNCGRCNQHDKKECELIGEELVLDLEAGSCRGWEDESAGDPELDFGPKGVATAQQLMYGVAVNGVGFGCKRCPFQSKAHEADSQGRAMFCGKGLFRVFPNACCALNGAKVKSEYIGNEPEATASIKAETKGFNWRDAK